MNKAIEVQDLGFKDYKDTWDFQEKLFQNIVEIKTQNRRKASNLKTPNHLLFVTHPHVYTLGKSGDISNLLLTEQQLHAIIVLLGIGFLSFGFKLFKHQSNQVARQLMLASVIYITTLQLIYVIDKII